MKQNTKPEANQFWSSVKRDQSENQLQNKKAIDSEEFINEVIDSEHLREFIRQWGNCPCRETIADI